MSWTDERVELLKKLWAEGASAGVIARELGGFEHCQDGGRSAVCGKVNRLGLSSHEIKTTTDGKKRGNPNTLNSGKLKAERRKADGTDPEIGNGPEVLPDRTNYNRFGKPTHLSSRQKRERGLLHLDADLMIGGGAFSGLDSDIASAFAQFYENPPAQAAE